MVRLNAWVAAWPLASVTLTVNEKVPVVVGVPKICPFGNSVRPGGSATAASDHVNAGASWPRTPKLVK
jgi:hypothetical protein